MIVVKEIIEFCSQVLLINLLAAFSKKTESESRSGVIIISFATRFRTPGLIGENRG